MTKLTEAEIFQRVRSIYQRYESEAGVARYRTALLFEQPSPPLDIRGVSDPWLVWLVAAESPGGTRHELNGYSTCEFAEGACIRWVGQDRQVSWEQVSPSAIIVMMSAITGSAWR